MASGVKGQPAEWRGVESLLTTLLQPLILVVSLISSCSTKRQSSVNVCEVISQEDLLRPEEPPPEQAAPSGGSQDPAGLRRELYCLCSTSLLLVSSCTLFLGPSFADTGIQLLSLPICDSPGILQVSSSSLGASGAISTHCSLQACGHLCSIQTSITGLPSQCHGSPLLYVSIYSFYWFYSSREL